MRRSIINRFTRDQRGAIAPLYAVGILTLVAVSAIGFDAGRLWALDTELQNAADQAALAAATQLDGGDDAIVRARDAANNTFASATSPFTNETRFANVGGRPIINLSFKFYDDYSGDAPGTELTSDDDGADARVVEVTVEPRIVRYALTPLVGAFSDRAIGKAVAGLQSATCDVAPMFFCLPHDGASNPIADFPRPQDSGREIQLHLRNNASETFTPGNFGFLDVGWSSSPANRELGLNVGPLGCFKSEPDQETVPGSRTPQGAALNTRFDIFGAPINNANACDSSNGDFCPSENVTKDWVNVQRKRQNQAPTCDSTPPNNSTWQRFSDVTDATLSNPGYPDDSAFTGILGNGSWSPETWISANHSGASVSDIPDINGDGSISRYEAFLWELSDPGSLLQPRSIGQSAVTGTGQGRGYNLYCAYPQPVQAPAWPQSETQKDRRILTVGAVDCSSDPPNGSAAVRIKRWVDLFLVRPINGSSETEYIAEVIGGAKKPNGDSGFQYFGRKKAVLIR